jgi:sugar/nucleoside kinase (ribokinase family)
LSIVVVGTIGLDVVETPFGRVEDVLGGSAIYFSVAASLYAPVQLVGIAGMDLPAAHLHSLRSRGIDLDGLELVPGRTFRWAGRYSYDLNSRETLETQLNVLTQFRPVLPERYRHAPYVFLANIDPELQLTVLEQVHHPALVLLDSMDFWIERKRPALDEVIGRVDVVLMNDEEVRQYCNTYNIVKAAGSLLAAGEQRRGGAQPTENAAQPPRNGKPWALIIKKGENGAILFTREGYFFAPAYPLEIVKDPTGAGDSFAGGFLGYLACAAPNGGFTGLTLKRAVVHGTVVASYTVEDFSIDRLRTITPADIETRYQQVREYTHFT